MLPVGKAIPVSITQTLAASKNNVGDGFTGVVASDVTLNGVTIIRRGTHVDGTVVAAKGKGKFKGAGDLAIQLNSVGGMRVSSSEYEVASKGKGKRTGGFIAGMTGAGMIIGGVATGGVGLAIGGAAGAGAGTLIAGATGNRDIEIPAESVVRFKLADDLVVQPS